jgi:hypothetical protein
MVVGLEMCPEYRIGYGWYTVYDMACGRFGKIPHVRNEIVDGLERCPVYGLGSGRYPA